VVLPVAKRLVPLSCFSHSVASSGAYEELHPHERQNVEATRVSFRASFELE